MRLPKHKLRSVSYVLSALLFVLASPVFAQSSSSNYSTNEYYFGTGGGDSSSANYSGCQSSGAAGVGSTNSSNFSAQGGFCTSDAPYLEMSVTNSNVDLGYLSKIAATTSTGTFTVKAYLASGYVVTNASDPPSNGSHNLTGLTSPSASSVGAEQFGINLVHNTSPATFGTNPVQVPDSTFSFGAASTGYDTANLYKYVKGDIVASSTKSSGETDYTIAYLFNISSLTPAGQYTFNHTIVVTATY
ncbi:MAG: exported protein of unknown function [Candidatus Saccharibacteria bacterium]|nr:exported protein of unknown function [Candidatus Saccharibacteria bacterium]